MADNEETLDDNDIAKFLLKTGKEVVSQLESIGKSLIKILGEAGEKAGSELVGKAGEAADQIKSTFYQKLKGVGFLDLDAIKENVEDAKKTLASIDENTGKVLIAAGLDEASLKEVFKSLSTVSNTEFIAKLTVFASAEEAIATTQKALKLVSDVEVEALGFSKRAYAQIKENLPNITVSVDGGSIKNIGDLTGGIEAYRKEVVGLVSAYGLSQAAAEEYMGNFLQNSGLAIEQVNSLKGAGDNASSGLQAVFEIAASTGLDSKAVGEGLGFMIRNLNISTDEAAKKFSVLAAVQSGSKISMHEVEQSVIKAAKEFKHYGDNIDSAGAVYKKFLSTFKDGREDLARPLFDSFITGISGMSDQMKAFLATTTSIGGTGGAISGILDIEEAFASGEGLEQVITGMTESIEKLSGAPLMTRKEAIDTGRQEQYFVQRQLAKDMTKISDPAQIDNLFKTLQGKDVNEFKQLVTSAGPASGIMDNRVQQVATLEAGGGAAQAMNRLDAASLSMSAGISDALIQNGANFNQKLDDTFTKQIASMGLIFSGKTLEEGINNFIKANPEVQKRNLEAGKLSTLSADQYDTSLESKNNLVETQKKTGIVTIEESNSLQKAQDRTGMELVERLDSYEKASTQTAIMLVESLNTHREAIEKTDMVFIDHLNSFKETNTRLKVDASTLNISDATNMNLTPTPAEDLAKAKMQAGGTSNIPVEAREIPVKVSLTMDPDGNINLIQVMNEIADNVSRSNISKSSSNME